VELSSVRRLFLIALVASMCATAALAVGILLFSEFDSTSGRILGTAGALAFFSLLARPAGVLVDRGLAAPLGWVALGLAALGLALVLVLLWIDWDDDPETLAKSALTVTVFAAAAAQAAATTARLREADPRSVRWLYTAGLAVCAALATMASAAAWGRSTRPASTGCCVRSRSSQCWSRCCSRSCARRRLPDRNEREASACA
jgi:hypothetical protein